MKNISKNKFWKLAPRFIDSKNISQIVLSSLLGLCIMLVSISFTFATDLTPNGIQGSTEILKTSTADIIIKGTITDENGEKLPGVSITLKGTTLGTLTNNNGEFTINVPNEKAILVFSYVGYLSQEQAVGSRASIKIRLVQDSKALDEVVVVGYGTRDKSEVTGAISQVKAEELTRTPIANVAQGLQAQVPGLQITSNSGAPGGAISVRLRGTNSISGSSEPLYIIDGVQVQNTFSNGVQVVAGGQQTATGGGSGDLSPLSNLNPNDIESVEVLKDASAAAIYGSQAANGVVIITTKRGKTSIPKVSYDGYYGVQSITKTLKVLNAIDFAKLENQSNTTPVYAQPDTLGEGTNWQNEIFRKAAIQNHQLSITSGSDKTKVAVSLNYFNQEGIIKKSEFNRYSIRFNLDQVLLPWLTIGTSTVLTKSTNNRVQTGTIPTDGGNLSNSIVGAALQAAPTLKAYKEDGSLYNWGEQLNGRYVEGKNPITGLRISDVVNSTNLLSNVYFDFKLAKGLKYKMSLSATLNNSLNDFYYPASISNAQERAASGGLGGYALKDNRNSQRLQHESIFTYDKSWQKHTLRLTGVYSNIINTSNFNYITASGFTSDGTTNEAVQFGQNFQVRSDRSKDNLDSYLGRISYSFSKRYYIDLTSRADGSSKFGANNKWAFFPAVSASWRVIEEEFLKNSKYISDLKLRLSHGITGNQAALNPYSSLATLSQTGDYTFNDAYTRGIGPTSVANPDVRWEKSVQSNIGVDLSLLNNKINLVVDAYYKRTNDLLFAKNLPLSSGYRTVLGNFASLENKGIELGININAIKTQDLSVKLGGNISINRNKLLALTDTTTEFQINNYNVLKVGQPIGIFRTYIFDGVYQSGENILPGSNAKVGWIKVKDVNNDGRITAADQVISGDANPKFIYGFTANITYKNFDFSTFFQGVYGNQIFNLANYQLEMPIGRNQLAETVNRWTPTNPNNEYQTAIQFGGNRTPTSDRYIEDGSFLRCKNITLGYRIKKTKFLSDARVYVSANNLFTITKYSGYDPEVSSFAGTNAQIGVDNVVYPVSRSFLAGLKITF
jgi:TonB-dependent starch-binding outer membrane protein SusC